MCNEKVISRSARKFVEPMLEEWVALIETNERVRDHMIKSVSGPTTYNEIRRFLKRRKSRFRMFSQKVEDAATTNATAA